MSRCQRALRLIRVIIMIMMIDRTVTVMGVGRQLRRWMMVVMSMVKRMMAKSVSYMLSFIGIPLQDHQD